MQNHLLLSRQRCNLSLTLSLHLSQTCTSLPLVLLRACYHHPSASQETGGGSTVLSLPAPWGKHVPQLRAMRWALLLGLQQTGNEIPGWLIT